jgi:hypothetical protein
MANRLFTMLVVVASLGFLAAPAAAGGNAVLVLYNGEGEWLGGFLHSALVVQVFGLMKRSTILLHLLLCSQGYLAGQEMH